VREVVQENVNFDKLQHIRQVPNDYRLVLAMLVNDRLRQMDLPEVDEGWLSTRIMYHLNGKLAYCGFYLVSSRRVADHVRLARKKSASQSGQTTDQQQSAAPLQDPAEIYHKGSVLAQRAKELGAAFPERQLED